MCGIAGLMTCDGSKPSQVVLKNMLKAIGHRGPDGQGIHTCKGVGLIQNRLAIIDLSGGNQPIQEPKGTTIIANAEIYNYIELRKELANVDFTTASDCEPPLHLYHYYGVDFAKKLRGMYALAIYDPLKDCLLLSRDPFGIKPLYYYTSDKYFAFASEPRAILNSGVSKRTADPQKRNELLQLQFTCGENTIFKGIKRVLPGETLVIRGGRVVDRRRITLFPNKSEHLRQVSSTDEACRSKI